MSEPIRRYIDCAVENGVGIVRFRYSQHRSLLDYDGIDEEVNAFVEGEDLRALILNLDAFDYVPSRFLGTMVALSKNLSATKRGFAVCRMHSASESAFLASRLDTIIPHYVSEEEALTAIE